MPEFEIECVDKETKRPYKTIVKGSTLERAQVRAANDGHLVVGLELPGHPAPSVIDRPIEAEETAANTFKMLSALDRLEKRVTSLDTTLSRISKHTGLIYFLIVLWIVLSLIALVLYILAAMAGSR